VRRLRRRTHPKEPLQTIAAHPIGEGRDYIPASAKIEFPNLVFTLAESKAQTWMDWLVDFVIKGNNGQDKEKNGTLIFLAPDHKRELARVEFLNLGIFSFTPDKLEAGGEMLRRAKVELYVEEIKFSI
jgi:hypothetical protein